MHGDGLGRRFWTLWTSFSISNLADGVSVVAFPLLAVAITDDARLVALVSAVRFFPYLVIGLPAGLVIDRFDRRQIAIASQVVRSAALGSVAVAVLADQPSITLLVIAGVIAGVGEVLVDGGLPAVVRDLVATDQLETANSRLRASETVANGFVGPPLGAFLFTVDRALPFIAGIVCFVLAAAALLLLPGRFRAERVDDEGSILQEMRAGLRYVWDHPILRPLAFAVAAFSFAGAAHGGVFVIFVTERIGLSEVQYGLLLSAEAVVSIVASFFVAGLVARTSHSWSMRVSVVTFAIHAAIYGAFTFVPIIVLAALIHGLADPTWNVISATVRQRLVDDHIFGRMMTAYLFIAWSFSPVGAIVGGIIAERWGTQWVFVMASAIVASLLVFAAPMFRRIDAAMAAQPPGT